MEMNFVLSGAYPCLILADLPLDLDGGPMLLSGEMLDIASYLGETYFMRFQS